MFFSCLFFRTGAGAQVSVLPGIQDGARVFTQGSIQVGAKSFTEAGTQVCMKAFSQAGAQVLGQPGRQNYKSLQNYIFRNLLFIVF